MRSQTRAGRAIARGYFADEIVRVHAKDAKGAEKTVEADEHPRPQTTIEQLARLKAPFRENGTVTAGNASGVNDGAAAMILASADALKTHHLRPRARVLGMATAGVPPRVMGIGPVPGDPEADGAPRAQDLRFRRDRAQRGLRRPGARRHPQPRASRTMPSTSTRTAARSRSAIRWARAARVSC